MKSLKFISILLGMLLLIFVFQACDDDGGTTTEPAQLNNISGTVNYPDGVAAGAIVFLAQGAEQTMQFDMSTVADASGNYAFENMANGDYFIYANFNTNNENVGNGRLDGMNFTSGDGNTVTIDGENVTQNITLVNIGQSEAFNVDMTDNGTWSLDLTHSNIDFAFAYDAINADFTGSFNAWGFEAVFDQTNPTAATFEASIDLLSVNTRSRGGRDPFEDQVTVEDSTYTTWDHGCLSSTFGVEFIDTDPPIDGHDGIPVEATRYATFKSTSVEVFGDGYKVTGDMTFNGETHTEEIIFKYIVGYQAENRGGVLTQFSSFDGKMEFEPLGDYGIESSHLLEETVTVYFAIQITTPV